MTSQAADGPETVTASRRSKITPEREREFFDAVLDQIRECGYDAVSMEGVAASTRCSKSTLYRQWKTKPQFVAAALRARSRPRFADIDTGSLAGDLREVAARAGAGWFGRDAQLLHGLSHAITQDECLRRALRDAFVEPEIRGLRKLLDRAVARGEIAADNPAMDYVPAQILGVLRSRPLLEGRDADEAYLTRFVDAAVLPALGLSGGPPGGTTGRGPSSGG